MREMNCSEVLSIYSYFRIETSSRHLRLANAVAEHEETTQRI